MWGELEFLIGQCLFLENAPSTDASSLHDDINKTRSASTSYFPAFNIQPPTHCDSPTDAPRQRYYATPKTMDSTIAALPASVAAYGKRNLRMDDLTLDDIGLEMHCPLDDGHLTLPTAAEPERPRKRQKRVRQGHDHNDTASSLSPSRGSDSALERLPLEISSMIFLQLDIPTIVSTRRVSRHIMASIDELHPYRRIRIHCPDVLRAAIGLSARSFDLATLYKTLRSRNCDQCGTACNGSEIKGSNDKGRLAGYLYMVTCTRVCYDCFVRHLDYFPVSLAQASKALGMPKAKILANNEKYPHILTIPGYYSWWKKIEKKSNILIDRAAVRSGFSQLPATESRAAQAACEAILKPKKDQKMTEVWRHVAIVSVPYFAPSRQSQSVDWGLDWGFYCTECYDNKELETHFRLKYTRDGLLQHLKDLHDVIGNEQETI